MESKLKRRNLQRFFLALFGYFLGGTIQTFVGENKGNTFLAGVAMAALLAIIFEGYLIWRKPEEKALMKMLGKDERLVLIMHKATMVSSYFVKFSIAAYVAYYAINDNYRKGMAPAIFFVVILLLEWGAYSYYRKRI